MLKPKMDVLPPAQKRLWVELGPSADLGFVLYGGTALALRLGHRPSVDFDFFTESPLDREVIKSAFPFIATSTVIQDKGDSWSMLVPCGDADRDFVKVSFFGSIGFGRVGEPDLTDDGVMQVASFDDLMATKVKVILQRAEVKDYIDIAAMIKAGVSLSRGMSAASSIFGANFQPSESLKALTYFGDGDLKSLSEAEKSILLKAVSSVRDLPEITILSRELATSTTLTNSDVCQSCGMVPCGCPKG